MTLCSCLGIPKCDKVVKSYSVRQTKHCPFIRSLKRLPDVPSGNNAHQTSNSITRDAGACLVDIILDGSFLDSYFECVQSMQRACCGKIAIEYELAGPIMVLADLPPPPPCTTQFGTCWLCTELYGQHRKLGTHTQRSLQCSAGPTHCSLGVWKEGNLAKPLHTLQSGNLALLQNGREVMWQSRQACKFESFSV